MYLRKGDEVIVIAGNDKGKTGIVTKILPKNRIVVEGIAMAKKHSKQEGIVEVEKSIDASNVNLYDAKNKKASRIGKETKDNKKARVLKTTGKEI